MTSQNTGFSAPDHGFHFVNAFDFSFNFALPFLPPVDVGKILYGLCGGMCFGALDYFHAGRPIPGQTNAPADSTPLYLYLVERQLASLALPQVPLQVMAWMLMDDERVWSLTVETEFPKLRASIDAQQPAVLALIRAKGASDPTRNHQVVGLAYDLDEPSQTVKIGLYDPNQPGQAPSLTLNLRRPFAEPGLTETSDVPARGFFVLNYQPNLPPGN